MSLNIRMARNVLLPTGTVAAAIALIWLLLRNSSSPYFPTLGAILSTFRHVWLFRDFGSDALPSIERVWAGFGIATVVGLIVGVATGSSPTMRAVFRPLMTFFRALPPTVLIPGIVVVFGLGTSSKIIVIAFVCLWPIAINVQEGVLGLDPTAMESARAFHIGGWQLLRSVVIPGVSPRLFAGLRMSMALAILMLVAAEMLGSVNGIGYYVIQAQQTYSMTDMWSGVIMLGLLGFAFNGVLSIAERRLLRWHVGVQMIEVR